jgi:Txe/YoeB family toxin of Txe-Axe toxin-antitoxin module
VPKLPPSFACRFNLVSASRFICSFIVVRGVRSDGTGLRMSREYIQQGIRSAAEHLCTRQLGYRTELDAMEAERREIAESRFTSLDRKIMREASNPNADFGPRYFEVVRNPTEAGLSETVRLRTQHVSARVSRRSALVTRTNRSTTLRILLLVEAVLADPFQGIGKPELLKYRLARGQSARREHYDLDAALGRVDAEVELTAKAFQKIVFTVRAGLYVKFVLALQVSFIDYRAVQSAF